MNCNNLPKNQCKDPCKWITTLKPNRKNYCRTKQNRITRTRKNTGVKSKCGKIPKKYLSGLSLKEKKQRIKEICLNKKLMKRNKKTRKVTHFNQNRFKTDKQAKTKRKSSYNVMFYRMYPFLKPNVAKGDYFKLREKTTGFPAKYLKQSFNRGMAAWATGHRPGQTQQQWGYARVSSLLMKGKTFEGPDKDLYLKALSDPKTDISKFKTHYRNVDNIIKN
jgi:hypothetical protein